MTEIVALSLRVSGIALVFSTLVGVPIGAALGLWRFMGRKLVVAFMYTGMGFPPVVIGLFVYLLLSRSGPLGQLNSPLIPNLFTPGAMIIAQTIIAFPLVAGFTMAAVMGVDPQLRQQVESLGATTWQTAWTVVSEARIGVIVAVVAGFGGIISEVGAVMLVGGNIEGRTRVLTTAIVLETRKGNFELAHRPGPDPAWASPSVDQRTDACVCKGASVRLMTGRALLPHARRCSTRPYGGPRRCCRCGPAGDPAAARFWRWSAPAAPARAPCCACSTSWSRPAPGADPLTATGSMAPTASRRSSHAAAR
ncbi:MAG: ABC transporter permease [Anaerolineae bacterium]